MSLRIKNIVSKRTVIIAVLLLGALFRLYRLEEFITFLGDQGRDAIILKRIITLEHFPAIGAPSSFGQIFLGPFYYYLIAPFLLLFNFNPVGPAFGVALLSCVGMVLSFIIVKKETTFWTAFLFALLLSFSAININFSRFSWNPNLLPFFSFLTLFFFYKAYAVDKKIIAFLAGAFLSFSFQLHHLAIMLLLPVVTLYFKLLLFHKKGEGIKIRTFIEKMGVAAIGFIFFSLPLILFDLRHDFLNSKNFFRFFIQGNPTDHERFINKVIETNQAFYSFIFQFTLPSFFALLLTVTLVFLVLKKVPLKKEKNFTLLHLLNFLFFLLFFSLINTSRNPHYYNAIYLSFLFIVSVVLLRITKTKIIRVTLIGLFICIYLYLNLRALTYLITPARSQIDVAEVIAQSITDSKPSGNYQTVALPNVETDGHIRYFLEMKGYRPLPAETTEEPKELYVLCFEACEVIGNPQWQIASFKNAKIDKIWTVEGVKIYKLVHSVNPKSKSLNPK